MLATGQGTTSAGLDDEDDLIDHHALEYRRGKPNAAHVYYLT